MSPRKPMTYLTAFTFVTLILALPAFAQHGDGSGGGHGQGMNDHMGGIHSGEMMEQMTNMMDHMSEMISDMHEIHEQFGTIMQGHESMGGMSGDHGAMMQPMIDGMDEMMPHMENMVNHMRSMMENPHDESMGESMGLLMNQMDAMLISCRDAMSTVHGMAAQGSGNQADTDHSEHQH